MGMVLIGPAFQRPETGEINLHGARPVTLINANQDLLGLELSEDFGRRFPSVRMITVQDDIWLRKSSDLIAQTAREMNR